MPVARGFGAARAHAGAAAAVVPRAAVPAVRTTEEAPPRLRVAFALGGTSARPRDTRSMPGARKTQKPGGCRRAVGPCVACAAGRAGRTGPSPPLWVLLAVADGSGGACTVAATDLPRRVDGTLTVTVWPCEWGWAVLAAWPTPMPLTQTGGGDRHAAAVAGTGRSHTPRALQLTGGTCVASSTGAGSSAPRAEAGPTALARGGVRVDIPARAGGVTIGPGVAPVAQAGLALGTAVGTRGAAARAVVPRGALRARRPAPVAGQWV